MGNVVLKKTKNLNGNYSCDELDITVEEWKSILQAVSVSDNYRLWLARFYHEPGHKASCKHMGEKFNCNPQSPNSIITNFGKAVQKILHRFEVRGTDNEPTYWIIPMKSGRYVDGYFEWTMRDELVQAMEELNMTNPHDFEGNKNKLKTWQEIYDKGNWIKTQWYDKYLETINLIGENVEKVHWNNDCIYRLLKSSNNGLSSLNWGLSNEHFEKINKNWNFYEERFNKIWTERNISQDLLESILTKTQELTGKNYSLVINRAICGLLPGIITNAPSTEFFYERLNLIKDIFPEIPDITGNWLLDNLNFVSYCKEQVDFQEEYHASGFIFDLYDYCIKLSSTGDPTMTQKNTLVEKNTDLLKSTKNLILTGAPGTGKTYLAKQIAEEMGCKPDEIGFVQFHPSYDYTDFVEGLRPVQDESGSGQIGFERKDGVFKEFCARALQNLVDSGKSVDVLQHEKTINEIVEDFLNDAVSKKIQFETITKNVFYVDSFTDRKVLVSIPQNEKVKTLPVSLDDILELMSNNVQLDIGKDVSEYFNRKWRTQQDSYIYVLTKQLQEIVRKNKNNTASTIEKVQAKNFVFIIDEINRGEVSKIFGELFYSVDSGYRVSAQDLEAVRAKEKQFTTIRTQYANLELTGNEFDRALGASDYGHFFVPENVYIIGTMNDIDRSVESMDFAFRRRFAWAEVEASDTEDMLDTLPQVWAEEAKRRMEKLNEAISATQDFGPAYHIGASYFLKLNQYEGNFERLWDYHIKGILEEYVRGHPNKTDLMEKFKAAYFLGKETSSEDEET